MKTAINSLKERLSLMIEIIPKKAANKDIINTYEHCLRMVQDYEKIEKQQIIEARESFHLKAVERINNIFNEFKIKQKLVFRKKEAQKYFNETYKTL